MSKNPYEMLSPHHYQLLLITGVVAGLGFFDFMAFWYSAEVITQLFFGNAGNDTTRYFYLIGAFAAGYLARPLGGWLLGNYGDRYGRKPAILLSLLGISLFTLIIALLPTYVHLGGVATVLFIVARIGQGMAFGSQLPALWTYITEQLPVNSIGFGCGLVMAATVMSGVLLLGLLALLDGTLTQGELFSFGWRIPFLTGAVLGLIALYFIKNLPETPVFLTQNPKASNNKLPISKRWQGVLTVVVLSWLISSVVTLIMVLLPDLVQLTFVLGNGLFNSAFILCLFFMAFSCLVFGFLTDRLNAGRVLAVGSVTFIAAFYALFCDLSAGGTFILISLSLTGLCAGILGAAPVVMVRMCPARHRLRTLAVAYNIVYALSGMTTPLLLGFVTYYADFAPVLYLSFVCIITMLWSFYIYYHPRNAADIAN